MELLLKPEIDILRSSIRSILFNAYRRKHFVFRPPSTTLVFSTIHRPLYAHAAFKLSDKIDTVLSKPNVLFDIVLYFSFFFFLLFFSIFQIVILGRNSWVNFIRFSVTRLKFCSQFFTNTFFYPRRAHAFAQSYARIKLNNSAYTLGYAT